MFGECKSQHSVKCFITRFQDERTHAPRPDILHALNPSQPPPPTTARVAGVVCITFALVLHGVALKAGLRLQNALGIFKLVVLSGSALTGLASLMRVPGFRLENVRISFSLGFPVVRAGVELVD